MPIYEYKCEKDGHTFEVRQGFSDDPVESCELCGAPVQRVFHPVAVHFKGKGFYNTDYGTRKRARELKDAAEGSSSSKDSGSNSDSSSTDSKSSESKSSESKSSDSKSSDSKSSGSKSESTKAAA
jgi:putative FmdB family regulatory protein